MKGEILLGVNIDHVATLREARRGQDPEPVLAALEAEQSGADAITVHLREDRRHINERDVELLARVLKTRMNLEMAATAAMLAIGERLRPADICFVPERREELTTEGGLDVVSSLSRIRDAVARIQENGTDVSLFIDSDLEQVEAASSCGARKIELHTGKYSGADNDVLRRNERDKIHAAARLGHELGLQVNAGHGLNYHNVQSIAGISEIVELNIGHSIICRAVFCGLSGAVREMKRLMVEARSAPGDGF